MRKDVRELRGSCANCMEVKVASHCARGAASCICQPGALLLSWGLSTLMNYCDDILTRINYQ
jgi:hypothetical protein